MFTEVLIKFYIDQLHSSNIVAFLLEIALCRVLVCYCLENLWHGLLTNIQLTIIFVKIWSVQFHSVKVWTYSISWRAVRGTGVNQTLYLTDCGGARPLFPQWSHHVYPQFLPNSHPNAPPAPSHLLRNNNNININNNGKAIRYPGLSRQG